MRTNNRRVFRHLLVIAVLHCGVTATGLLGEETANTGKVLSKGIAAVVSIPKKATLGERFALTSGSQFGLTNTAAEGRPSSSRRTVKRSRDGKPLVRVNHGPETAVLSVRRKRGRLEVAAILGHRRAPQMRPLAGGIVRHKPKGRSTCAEPVPHWRSA
jgi:hypothetical protein